MDPSASTILRVLGFESQAQLLHFFDVYSWNLYYINNKNKQFCETDDLINLSFPGINETHHLSSTKCFLDKVLPKI